MTPMQEVAPIQDIPLDIGIELDRHMLTIREIIDLDVGSVIQMNRSAGENIDIYVGRKLVAHGEIVIIENAMGVRITNFKAGE
jgi:flagellar motor switch protein FliN/FliY